MEFLLIGDSKLKIVMSETDMRTYKLDACADYSSSVYRRAFWRVLEKAKAEVGFDPDGDKVLIQFYPVKSGGCEVFVTKLGLLPKESARSVCRSDKVAMLSRGKSFYRFESYTDLKRFALALGSVADTYPGADIYISDEGRYFLAIEEYKKGGEPAEFPFILEFSDLLTADFSYYITEHCRLLTEGNAIEELLRTTSS
ncbi:MAG: adaptor protein MecA [Clostridia bacterium]|nr:adaptor protein MecA [Clostridia bacterium]